MAPAREFRRDAAGALVARVDRRERAVLADVVEGVVDLLASRSAVHPSTSQADVGVHVALDGLVEAGSGPGWPAIEPPQDPALRRLLPDASGDPELAAELRRLTEADLCETKAYQVALLHAALAAGTPDVVVAGGDVGAVVAAFTDVRLVLGERLGLKDDADGERLYALAAAGETSPVDDEDATARFLAAVYVVLSELQESLVERLVEDLPPVRGGAMT